MVGRDSTRLGTKQERDDLPHPRLVPCPKASAGRLFPHAGEKRGFRIFERAFRIRMGGRHKGVQTGWHGPMDEAAVTVATPERDYLSGADIGAAIEALSPGDKLKLAAIDDRMRGGTGLGRGDLVQEAVLRALDGSRKCPRSISIMAFLVESMRSIAGHERVKNRRNVPLTEVGETLDASVLDPAILPRNAEDGLIDKQESAVVQAIHAEFEDDPEAQLVLMGWMDGLRGAAMLEATDLNQGQFDYAAKRIRTKMRRLYPQGWLT